MSNHRNGDSFARAEEVLEDVRRFFRRQRLHVTVTGVRCEAAKRPVVYLHYTKALDRMDGIAVHGPATRGGMRCSLALRGISLRWIRPEGAA
jgi:hypothetical protein